jgi:glutathionylspermidine synthase
MPTTVASSVAEAEKMINRAKEALTEAAKRWKKNQDGVKRMISYCRGDISDRILGRTKPALRDIPDEVLCICIFIVPFNFS